MNKRIRISALLITIGLLIEFITLLWDHPLSFILFTGIGGLLLAAGILFFLFSLSINTKALEQDEN